MRVDRLRSFDERVLAQLAEVLIDCVEGGASVSFMLPLSRQKAGEYWRGVAESAARGERALLAALDSSERIVGTVQLLLNLPENQPHRGDLAKMLVHRRARRAGVGAALLALSAGVTASSDALAQSSGVDLLASSANTTLSQSSFPPFANAPRALCSPKPAGWSAWCKTWFRTASRNPAP